MLVDRVQGWSLYIPKHSGQSSMTPSVVASPAALESSARAGGKPVCGCWRGLDLNSSKRYFFF